MYGPGFDALTRTFSTPRARRGLAQLLLGAVIGGQQVLGDLNEVETARRKRRKRQQRRDHRRRDRDQQPSDALQAESKKRKKKSCPPCRKRKKGKCKGKLPDGAACPGGTCQAGNCVSTTSPPICTPSCTGRDCGDDGCGQSCGACSGGLACQNGQCVLTCADGLTACDGNCVDLQADSQHCGSCGAPCSLPHASASCQGGVCTLEACDAGFGNCDGDPATGCEHDIRADLDNCGVCGHQCAAAPANATAMCADGACSYACDAGFHKCDNNCVSNNDPAHCGSRCSPCPGSLCSPATCDGTTCGRAPIDGCCEHDGDCGDSNACTTDTCGEDHTCQHTAVTCPDYGPCYDAVCDPGQGCLPVARCQADEVCVEDGEQVHCCPQSHPLWDGSQCVVCLAHDVSNCPRPPNAIATCTAQGECSYECEAFWGDCGPGAGCETDFRFNTSHCGACGQACTGGQVCNGGCFCPGHLEWCGNVCTDLEGDPINCGACGIVCGTGEICQGYVCTPTPWVNQTTFGDQGGGAAQFDIPKGLAVSPDGLTLYVADTDNHRISIWTRTSADSAEWTNQSTFGTGPASGSDQFRSPHGVALAGDGLTAVIADQSNARISVWVRSSPETFDWESQTTFGSRDPGPDQLSLPSGLAITPDGKTVFVADEDLDRVSVWTRSTTSSTDWAHHSTFGGTGTGPSRLSSPGDVCVSGDGLIAYVADTSKERIAVWTRTSADSADWTLQSTFGGQGIGVGEFDYPEGVFASPDNLTVYVSDVSTDRISIWARISADSTVWTHQAAFGTNGSNVNQFSFPSGVVASADGTTLFIADSHNSRISVWVRP